MAGGKHGRVVPCMVCLDEGRLTRAWRVVEGTESDQYLCLRWWVWGHRFGMDYRRGPAEAPQWPPPRELVEFVKKQRG